MKLLSVLAIFVYSLQIGLSNNPEPPLINNAQKTCQEVFDNLKTALGINLNDPPLLKIVTSLPVSNFLLAMADNSKGEIYIEKRTLNLCLSQMGADSLNSLAFLLSHELAHYTHKHTVRHHFVQSGGAEISAIRTIPTNSLDSIVQVYNEVATKYQIRTNESEADLDAGFTMYLAGYHSKDAGAKFLEKAYNTFNINKNGGNYASLDERMEIAKRAGNKLDTLVRVFEMANYLNILNEVKLSTACYEYVSKYFRSNVVLNNKGVLYLNQASNLLSVEDIRYALPVTIDMQLFSSDKDVDDPDELLRIERLEYKEKMDLLSEAIANFDQAILLDPNYTPAYLNKSIAHYLINVVKKKHRMVSSYVADDLSFAESAVLLARQVEETKTIKNEKTLSDVYVQLAILADVNKNVDSTTVFINKALALNAKSKIAKVNKGLFEGESNSFREYMESKQNETAKRCKEKEMPFNNTSFDQLMQDSVSTNWSLDIQLNYSNKTYTTKETKFQYYESPLYSYYRVVYFLNSDINNQARVFEGTNLYTNPTACDMERGFEKDDWDFEYGNPTMSIETTTGSIIEYHEPDLRFKEGYRYKDGIMFKLDKDQVIENWLIYQIQNK